MLLRKTFRFEASHLLPKHPGKCSRLHGHSWVLHVETEGRINPSTGFVMDFADMSAAVKPLIELLDHRHLGQWHNDEMQNAIPTDIKFSKRNDSELGTSHTVYGLPNDFYPTSENLLFWIGEQLAAKKFPWSKLAIEETCTSYAELGLAEFMVYYSNKYGLDASAEALSGWKGIEN